MMVRLGVLIAVFLIGCTSEVRDQPIALEAVVDAGEGSDAPILSDYSEQVCFDDGVCADCSSGTCTLCSAGTCQTCDETWEFGSITSEPVPTATGIIYSPPAGAVSLEITADGTGIFRDVAGRVLQTIRGFASRVGGQWVINWSAAARAGVSNLAGITRTILPRCIGGIAAMLLLSEMVYAGMEYSLGDAAKAMGVRLQDCQDRFAKHVAGITCLLRQPVTNQCTDAVKACPDAFFGANLIQSCGTEPGMQDLIDALVRAINSTSTYAGGAGTISPDPANTISDAIKQGKFATDPSITCSMRALLKSCTFYPGSVFPSPAGFDEAKACWENASRGIFESKWEQANKCCTTDACRMFISTMKSC
ncbi:MAG TPA: hypothetical protein VFQ53_40995 [Kofleriaceae bacterium]|nr:hypothetical protein [Kofleriaceae bacterium]